MRQIVFALMMVAGMALPGRADEAAMRQVIQDQITAFQVDDFETAFTYASPSIRGMFQTPENFGTMVREGYPMVWRPEEVQFLSAEVIAGKQWQNVLVRDAAGALHILEYQMMMGEDGWKINAVNLRKAPAGTV